MNMFDYLQLSARTAAELEHPRRDVFKTDADLCSQLLPVMAAGRMADYTKRCVFYREDVAKTQERAEKGNNELGLLSEAIEVMRDENSQKLLGLTRIDLIHAALGLISEAGEILEEVVESYADDRPVDLTNIREELGDAEWYQALGLRASDATFESVAEQNIEKLRIRYPEKFTSENALNRDLQAEKQALK